MVPASVFLSPSNIYAPAHSADPRTFVATAIWSCIPHPAIHSSSNTPDEPFQ
ncbi:hypothetical protein FOMPIDRAFT_94716 [Fomitopsis schrenkii]|uniref:Uncharacterized protein n=1 Tax=Fomitopsis schrenkii TaxID=2126942 RepID=S8DIN2_FOMSC|nr:hypothetical protein FOMPIDRAFT_1055951 [Fomitopsis schrenkii]EPS97770.1 hypothetical protein FOMPIDRAFT_94716 [Fomitopsis schrenkii]